MTPVAEQEQTQTTALATNNGAQAADSSPDAPVANDLYNVTVVEYAELDKKGKAVREVLTDTEAAHKLVEEGKAKILFEQAFNIAKAKTVDGINVLCQDNDNIVYFWNTGAVGRQKNRANARVLDTDEQGNLTWSPTTEPFSMAEALNEEISRRNLSPLEKAMKQLDGLPDAVKKVLIEQLQKQVSGQ